MRGSNWLTLGIAFLISVILLGAWFGAGLNKVDGPVDIIATAVWWAAILTAGLAIVLAERTRRRRLRTAFLAPGVIFNPEMGFVLIPEDQSPVAMLQKMLDKMEYRVPQEPPAERLHPRFTHIIRTYKYTPGAKVWQGEVARAARPDLTRRFESREELAEILTLNKLAGNEEEAASRPTGHPHRRPASEVKRKEPTISHRKRVSAETVDHGGAL